MKTEESQANVASAQAADSALSEQVLIEEISSEPEVGEETKTSQQTPDSFSKHDFATEAEAYFSEAIVEKTREFFFHRKAVGQASFRKPSMPPQIRPSAENEEGLISKAGRTTGFDTNGMAILDTGASRSVIGDANLPKLMNQLPPVVRSRVKEQASRVAFRFGNNQIEHSYKQVHIPIDNKKIRMWLIIEVVPKQTPFLLSIQTMKRLGTVIDLHHSTCFLKSMNRSVKLHEGKTGLLMINVKDLCQEAVECHSVFGASSNSKADSHFVEQNANPRGNAAHGEEHCRTCRSVTPDTAHDPFESGGNSSLESRGSIGTGDHDERVAVRGTVPEREDRRVGRHHEAASQLAHTGGRGLHSADRERSGSVGPRGPSISTTTTSSSRLKGATDASEGSDNSDDSTKGEADGSRERELPRPTDIKSRGRCCKSGWNNIS